MSMVSRSIIWIFLNPVRTRFLSSSHPMPPAPTIRRDVSRTVSLTRCWTVILTQVVVITKTILTGLIIWGRDRGVQHRKNFPGITYRLKLNVNLGFPFPSGKFSSFTTMSYSGSQLKIPHIRQSIITVYPLFRCPTKVCSM